MNSKGEDMGLLDAFVILFILMLAVVVFQLLDSEKQDRLTANADDFAFPASGHLVVSALKAPIATSSGDFDNLYELVIAGNGNELIRNEVLSEIEALYRILNREEAVYGFGIKYPDGSGTLDTVCGPSITDLGLGATQVEEGRPQAACAPYVVYLPLPSNEGNNVEFVKVSGYVNTRRSAQNEE